MDGAQQRVERSSDPGPAHDRGSWADRFVDDLLPDDFDWRDKVRTYPLAALAVAAAAGFLLGSQHGRELLSAVRLFADREVSKNVQALLGDDR